MDTGTWLSRSHANGHKNVSRRVNCYNEECAARECAANFSTVLAWQDHQPAVQVAFFAGEGGARVKCVGGLQFSADQSKGVQ